jgi:hypothetical protein
MAPTLATLGHGTVRQNGRPAAGGRPLLIVLGEYSNFPPFSTEHTLQYYERLGFGNPTPPFSTDNPVNPASLREYFHENSNGRFRFDRVAVVGPVALGVYANDPGPEERTAGILRRVAEFAPQLFVGADVDSDRLVEFDELTVLLFENITGLQPANRDNNPFSISLDLGIVTWRVTVRVHIAGAGPLTPFYQIAHELSHSIGTIDMYNTGAGNRLLTLMGAYPFFTDDQVHRAPGCLAQACPRLGRAAHLLYASAKFRNRAGGSGWRDRLVGPVSRIERVLHDRAPPAERSRPPLRRELPSRWRAGLASAAGHGEWCRASRRSEPYSRRVGGVDGGNANADLEMG